MLNRESSTCMSSYKWRIVAYVIMLTPITVVTCAFVGQAFDIEPHHNHTQSFGAKIGAGIGAVIPPVFGSVAATVFYCKGGDTNDEPSLYEKSESVFSNFFSFFSFRNQERITVDEMPILKRELRLT